MSGEFQKRNFNYNNAQCRHKIFSRKRLLEELRNQKITEVRYAGLPSKWPELEEFLMYKYSDLKMFLAEIKLDIYKQQKKILFKNQLGVYQEVVHHYGNLLEATIEFPLNFIWFDLCSMFTETITNELFVFFQRNRIEDKGVFGLTWFATRERDNEKNLYKQLQAHYLKTDFESLKDYKKNCVDKVLEAMLSEITGKKFVCKTNMQYRSDTKAFMQFVVLTWS